GRLAGLGRADAVPRSGRGTGLVRVARVPRDRRPASRQRDLRPRARRQPARRLHHRRLRGRRPHGDRRSRGMNIRRSLGLGVAIIGIVLMMAAASAPSPFYPAIQSRLGMTPGAVTAVFAIYTVVLLAALLTTGRLSEHVGRRPVLSVGF